MDPFLGTGTTAAVAKKLGRKYFGIEKDKKLYDNTINEGAKKQWITQAVDNPTANLSEFICALSIYFLQPPLSNILR